MKKQYTITIEANDEIDCKFFAKMLLKHGFVVNVQEPDEHANQFKAADQWVSVEDRLPDFDTPVLVYCKLYGRFIATHQYVGSFGGERFGNWHDGKQLGILPPLFWQPLPAPPTTQPQSNNENDPEEVLP